MTGLILPASIPSARGWQLTDYKDLTLRSKVTANTIGTVTGPQLEQDELWLIDHMVIACEESDSPYFRLYDSPSLSVTDYLDGTDTGSFDAADWPNGLQLRPGRQLVGLWFLAFPGAECGLRVQYRLLRQVG